MEITSKELERSAIAFLYKTVEDEKKVKSLGGNYDRQMVQNTGIDAILYSWKILSKFKRDAQEAVSLKEGNKWADCLGFLTGLRTGLYLDNLSINRIRDVLFLMDEGVIRNDQKEALDSVFSPFVERVKNHKHRKELRKTRFSNLSSVSKMACFSCDNADFMISDDAKNPGRALLNVFCFEREAFVEEKIGDPKN